MRKLLLTLAFLLMVVISSSAPALAFNTRITVYASVAEMRIIYVDNNGYIVKIVGNTSRNITPQVYDENNQPLAMTESINSQYQLFLKSHNYHLQASKWYYINPVAVNNLPNDQKIQLGSASQLSLSL